MICIEIFHFPDNFFTTAPNYLMKVDDDAFVNLPKVYQLLTENTLYKNLNHLLLGKCYCDNPPVLKVPNFVIFFHLFKFFHEAIQRVLCDLIFTEIQFDR